MSAPFLFRYKDVNSKSKSNLVVFGESDLTESSIISIIKKDILDFLLPSKLYVITTESYSDKLRSISKENSFLKELENLLGDCENIKFAYVDCNLEFSDLDELGTKISKSISAKIIHEGALAIFKKRRGLLTSSSNYHFVKPSGDHCDKFIRVSNLLTSGAEVTFLALALLPKLNDSIERIYIDTSSIAYLISRAIQISGKFVSTPPSIESFESYAAFDQEFDFVTGQTSLVIVSATASGSLVKKLLAENSFHNGNVLTLFHYNMPVNQSGIYSLDGTIENGIISRKASNCKFCNEDDSRGIHIVGEQFLPETPRHNKLLIRKPDFTVKRSVFFNEFATKNILKWDVVQDSNSLESEHFFFDLELVCKNIALFNDFKNSLDTSLNRHFTRDIDTLVSLDDVGSIALKDLVVGYLESLGQSDLKHLRLDDLKSNDLKDGKSVMVVCGSITAGRKLLSAARKLRCLNEFSSTKYLVGLSKLPKNSDLEQLEKDLGQGGNDLIVLRKCPMPRVKSHVKTSWNSETHFLKKFTDDLADDNEHDLTKYLATRLKQLEDEEDLEELFLMTPLDKNLELRGTFAFWSDLELDCSSATQSDVYWTIQSILHDLRLQNENKGLSSVYHSTVLSPVCFDRFNDGVIQACILRAALPSELNYTIDEQYSRQMTDVLLSILTSWEDDQGEASLEFLLALCTKRLKIQDIHLSEILSLDKTHMPENMKFLFEHLE